MKKVLLVLLVALLAAAGARAQVTRDGFATLQYDVDSTSLTYCKVSGADGGPFGGPIQGTARIKTTGSSTTVAALTATTLPFRDLAVGSVLVIYPQTPSSPTTPSFRVVTVKTDGDTVTVDTAIDLSASGGYTFGYYNQTCDTAATAGWFTIPANASRVAMTVVFEQGDITTLSARWECRPVGMASALVIVYPGETSDCGLGGTLATDRCTWAQAKSGAADGSYTFVLENPVYGQCRVGLAYVTTDTADTTTLLEKVTVALAVR